MDEDFSIAEAAPAPDASPMQAETALAPDVSPGQNELQLEPQPAQNESRLDPQLAPLASADLRVQMLARFECWLDQMLAGEPPPRGVPEHFLAEATAALNGQPPAPETDLYTLFYSLTGLTGEIKLQGRAFKQLTDLLTPLSEAPALLARLRDAQAETTLSIQAALAQEANDGDSAPPVDFKDVCGLMIDLFDRLQRALQTCDEGIRSIKARNRDSLLRRLLGDAKTSEQAVLCVQAIRDAAGLSLARLGASLQEWGVERIGRVGEMFDPNRMAVVEAAASSQPPGTVLLVNRSGYAINGTVKVIAQVTVSKPGT